MSFNLFDVIILSTLFFFSEEQLFQVYKAQLELFIEAFPLVYYAKSSMDAEANKQFELGKTLITKIYSDLFTRETKLINLNKAA